MADIRDWGLFLRGRWDWTRGGYERNFPRGCQFTDVDASIEFNGWFLQKETKHHDGTDGQFSYPPNGQLMALRKEHGLGKSVFVVYGCGPCNSPQGVRILGAMFKEDRTYDWRGLPVEERRIRLKKLIDIAMGWDGNRWRNRMETERPVFPPADGNTH